MKYLIFVLLGATALACTTRLTDEQKAEQHINEACKLLESNQLNNAKSELDSVHILYPKQVSARRVAKYLSDSIGYIESKRTLVYCDSVLEIKKQELAVLQKDFRLEYNEQYQNVGHYVYKLLRTENNTERCYLQSYVSENAEVVLKSTYCGSSKIGHTHVELSANELSVNSGEVSTNKASNHSFSDGGLTWEMLMFKDESALSLLNFISAQEKERIKVTLLGGNRYIYYLMDSEKKALAATYHFAVVMRDVAQLEMEIKKAHHKIQKFEGVQ